MNHSEQGVQVELWEDNAVTPAGCALIGLSWLTKNRR